LDPRFLLAQLHVDSLAKKHNRKAVREALKALPKEIDETYDEVLQRIERQDPKDADLAKRILAWISYAKRPLSISEQQHALGTIPRASDIDDDTLIPEDLLMSVCAGITTIERESRIVRLVHYTTEEYFERYRHQLFLNVESVIGLTCLTYLKFDLFENSSLKLDLFDNPSFVKTNLGKRYLLGQYVWEHWEEHIRGPAESILDSDLRNLFSRATIFRLHSPHIFPSGIAMEEIINSPLHTTALFGFDAFCSSLLRDRSGIGDVDARSMSGKTPLAFAAARGYQSVIKRLIEYGADCNAADSYGRTPLIAAASCGEVGAVRLLLDFGADVNHIDTIGNSALLGASLSGNEESMPVLIESGVDLNVRGDGEMPLKVIEEIRPILLGLTSMLADAGANPGVRGDYGLTILFHETRNHRSDTVSLLVEAGADLEVATLNGDTPLLLAARFGDEEIVRILIRAGAALDPLNHKGFTPLAAAVRGNHVSIVRRLLRAGADVHRKDEKGILALSRIKDASIDRQIRLLLVKAAIALVDENVREGGEADEREGGLDNRDYGREDVQMGLDERNPIRELPWGRRIHIILE
jgi:ankyrin repeat protein